MDDRSWLEHFESVRGRRLRILHIGNVANNAYLNAKILSRIGVDSHVLCNDYYHVMGCPEWEDADIERALGSEFAPRLHAVETNEFRRPRWFAQGPLSVCSRYLRARNEGSRLKEDIFWWVLDRSKNPTIRRALYSAIRILHATGVYPVRMVAKGVKVAGYAGSRSLIPGGGETGKTGAANHSTGWYRVGAFSTGSVGPGRTASIAHETRGAAWTKSSTGAGEGLPGLITRFRAAFPEHAKPLTIGELRPYRSSSRQWRRLLREYDVVHAYGTSGVFPLLCDIPYVAYEHGTIRQLPFEDTTQGKLCALTYCCADHVVITNCDTVKRADALGVSRYTFVPHPVNEDFPESNESRTSLRKRFRIRFESEFVVFHPARQHWGEDRNPSWEKGNDIFFRGFAHFVKKLDARAGCVAVAWGQKLDESKRLLKELGISERVQWIPPRPNRDMIRCIRASDLVADQFWLGSFGSTMPKALAVGCPAMLYFEPEYHHWCFDEMPPVLSAHTPEEVARGIEKLYLDTSYRRRIIDAGRDWYRTWHSNTVISDRLLGIYRDMVDGPSRRGAAR